MAPQGSDDFATPLAAARWATSMPPSVWTRANSNTRRGRAPRLEIPVGRSFEHIRAPYGIYFGANFGQQPGAWVVDPWGRKLDGAPMPAAMRAEILKYRELGAERGPDGYDHPHKLDEITMEDYMMQRFGLSRETIRKFLLPGPGDGFVSVRTHFPPTLLVLTAIP